MSYCAIQKEVLETAAELGVCLISYSPLGLGVLTGRYGPDNLPSGPRGFLFRRLLEGSADVRAVQEEIAKQRNKTMS